MNSSSERVINAVSAINKMEKLRSDKKNNNNSHSLKK